MPTDISVSTAQKSAVALLTPTAYSLSPLCQPGRYISGAVMLCVIIVGTFETADPPSRQVCSVFETHYVSESFPIHHL